MSLPPHDPLLNARVADGAADIVTCTQSLHKTEPAGTLAEIGRILFARTIGIVPPVLELGLSDDELGSTVLREVAERTLGPDGLPWYESYRVRVGVK